MFRSGEQKEKIERITELKEAGLNIPRFFYLYKDAHDILRENAIFWAKEIHENNPDQIFNIRTYNYFPNTKIESVQNPHLTDLSFKDLVRQLSIANSAYSCMVDAETPDNGRIAGNILIEENNRFTIEFVVKEKRAMVRDINSHKPLYSISGKYADTYRLIREYFSDKNLPIIDIPVLSFTIHTAFTLKKENIILEFTYFNVSSGIFYKENNFPESNIVFWEYRKF